MILISDANGKITAVDASAISQGSTAANDVYLVAPFADTTVVMAGFVLPNGIIMTPKIAEKADAGAIVSNYAGTPLTDFGGAGMRDKDGKILNAWKFTLDAPLTQIPGTLRMQFYALSNRQVTRSKAIVNGNGSVISTQETANAPEVVATSSVNINVGVGAPYIEPTTGEDADYFEAIVTALNQALNAAKTAETDAKTASDAAAEAEKNAEYIKAIEPDLARKTGGNIFSGTQEFEAHSLFVGGETTGAPRGIFIYEDIVSPPEAQELTGTFIGVDEGGMAIIADAVYSILTGEITISQAAPLRVADSGTEDAALNNAAASAKFLAQEDAKEQYAPYSRVPYKLYGTDANGTFTVRPFNDIPTAGSIVQYSSGATVKTAEPQDNNDAASKGYADGKFLPNAGGTITGDLSINGNLNVKGSTTSEEVKTLTVKDAFIVTNENGEETKATLSGILMKTSATKAYAIVYEPGTDSVKLGEGTYSVDETTGETTFTFDDQEGTAVATRAQDTNWEDGDLATWDAGSKSFIPTGKKASDITTVTTNGVPQATVESEKFVNRTHVTDGTSNIVVYTNNAGKDSYYYVTSEMYPNNIIARDVGGRAKVNDPVEEKDIVNKQYAEANFVSVPKDKVSFIIPAFQGGVQSYRGVSYGNTANNFVFTTTSGHINILEPTASNHPATKKYVDDALASASSRKNYLLYLNGGPSCPMGYSYATFSAGEGETVNLNINPNRSTREGSADYTPFSISFAIQIANGEATIQTVDINMAPRIVYIDDAAGTVHCQVVTAEKQALLDDVPLYEGNNLAYFVVAEEA